MRLSVLARIIGLNKGPLKVGLQITRSCNLSCIQCSAQAVAEVQNELSTGEVKKLILDLKKLRIAFLVFTGGEPLLRKDIYELVEFSSRSGLHTALATNGTLLTEEKAQAFKTIDLRWFHISIDGPNSDIHDTFRGQGSFDAAIQGLRSAIKTGVSVNVTTTINRHNKDHLRDIMVLLIREGVTQCSLTPLVPCGQAKDIYAEYAVNKKEETLALLESIYQLEKDFRKKIKIYFHDPQFYHAFLFIKKNIGPLKRMAIWMRGGCAVLKGYTIYIKSDGSVKPCAYFPDNVCCGNIRVSNITDIYHNNSLLKALRNKNNLKGRCAGCRYLFCCGGCRARAYQQSADYFNMDYDCPFYEPD